MDVWVIGVIVGVICVGIALFFKSSPSSIKKSVPKPLPAKPAASKELNPTPKKLTRAEVKKHNKRDDCWLIIDNKVYDVTSYVEEHRGGDAILNNAGDDSTDGFKGNQHPENVTTLVKEFYIGDLVD